MVYALFHGKNNVERSMTCLLRLNDALLNLKPGKFPSAKRSLLFLHIFKVFVKFFNLISNRLAIFQIIKKYVSAKNIPNEKVCVFKHHKN